MSNTESPFTPRRVTTERIKSALLLITKAGLRANHPNAQTAAVLLADTVPHDPVYTDAAATRLASIAGDIKRAVTVAHADVDPLAATVVMMGRTEYPGDRDPYYRLIVACAAEVAPSDADVREVIQQIVDTTPDGIDAHLPEAGPEAMCAAIIGEAEKRLGVSVSGAFHADLLTHLTARHAALTPPALEAAPAADPVVEAATGGEAPAPDAAPAETAPTKTAKKPAPRI